MNWNKYRVGLFCEAVYYAVKEREFVDEILRD